MNVENAVVIINKTRLESLVERFNTRAQARFYIEHSGGDFRDYEIEHETFHRSLDTVVELLQQELKMKVVERKFVPNFLFSEKDLVVVVGQDGLVANAAKYVNGLPILAVNPDPVRYDGVLLPFNTANFAKGFRGVLERTAQCELVTMAEARTNDGQRLLAFNDLFIGPASHTSARYTITYDGERELQSSSGIIVSTGAGSTGWLSSVFNMADTVTDMFGAFSEGSQNCISLHWDTDRMPFVVREPFKSNHSGISLTAGWIYPGAKLIIESHMPVNGVIFSDGIEADFIQFNSGTMAEVGIADQKARLVVSQ